MARRARVVRGWIVAPVVAAALLLVPMPAEFVEAYYSRGVYPRLQQVVTLVSNFVPLAVLDILIGIAVLFVLLRIVLLFGTVGSHGVIAAIWEGARRLLRGAAILVIVFVCMWGLNYRRPPLEASLGEPPAPTVSTLTAAISDANALAASLRSTLGDDRDLTYAQAADRLGAPMSTALAEVDREVRFRPGRPKYSLLLTPFFTWAGVNGMLNPFALESVVHPELLPFERSFVLAHEWAHLTGQADEAEASAVGWLACMRGDGATAYSASLYLILEAGGALPRDARTKAFAALDEGVREDLQQIAERMRRQQHPRVQRATSRVYDEYLRANQVEDGTASYGRALTLILSPKLRVALDEYPAR